MYGGATIKRVAAPLFLALLLGPGAAHAAPLNVTKAADTDDGDCSLVDCSLREAADDSAPGDTVVLGSDVDQVDLGQIDIERALTIQGLGPGPTVVDADDNSRVFHITSGVADAATVTFQGLTIREGVTNLAPGGAGILADAGSGALALVNATLTGNAANVADLGANVIGGGGIYSNSGGGISLTNSSVSVNTTTVTATGGCCHGGGGIYGNAGPITIVDSHVDGNTMGLSGALSDGSTNCCSGGGGLYQDGESNTAITRSTVDGNTVIITSGDCCFGGGGLFISNLDPEDSTTLTDTTVNGNTVSVTGPAATTPSDLHCCSGGGGIWSANGLTMTGGAVNGNTAGVTAGDCCHGGGGIYSIGDERVTAITRANLNDNTLNVNGSGPANGGGALNLTTNLNTDIPLATRLTVLESLVSGNDANITGGATESGGGGLHVQVHGVNSITNSTISGNTTTAGGAGQGGGGLRVPMVGPDAQSLTLANVTIAGNSAAAGFGGGILSDGQQIRSKNTLVGLNSAPSGADCLAVNAGTFPSLGYNLEGAPGTCAFTGAGDQVVANGSLGLGPLAANGGPTSTRALLAGSPAIDRGNPGGCTTAAGAPLTRDQRGLLRPSGPRCDIGAFELASTLGGGPPATPKQPAPTCTLKPKSRKATRTGRVKLTARCDQNASVSVSGRVKVRAKRKKAKTYKFKRVRKSVKGGTALTLTVKLPKKALRALKKAAKESATFTLTATNANGADTARATIKRLKIAKAKKRKKKS